MKEQRESQEDSENAQHNSEEHYKCQCYCPLDLAESDTIVTLANFEGFFLVALSHQRASVFRIKHFCRDHKKGFSWYHERIQFVISCMHLNNHRLTRRIPPGYLRTSHHSSSHPTHKARLKRRRGSVARIFFRDFGLSRIKSRAFSFSELSFFFPSRCLPTNLDYYFF